MVAGFVSGYLETEDFHKAFRMGLATGSASAFSPDLATRPEVEALLETFCSRFIPSRGMNILYAGSRGVYLPGFFFFCGALFSPSHPYSSHSRHLHSDLLSYRLSFLVFTIFS